MIIAENLTKRYGSALALDRVTFKIQSGDSVALWGANGAGKTTALRCLLGVLPFEGRLTVDGIDVQTKGKAARSIIGYVPQEATFHDLTVWETLQFYARLRKVSLQRIPEVLGSAQLVHQEAKHVDALSGGMKQKLALAVALLSDPPILVLDEPTANLDAAAQRDFIQMIQNLNGAGKTIVFSSHRMDEVLVLASRVLVLREGRLSTECTPEELAENLGLRQWLRIRMPAIHHSDAQRLLREQGYTFMPNGQSIFVRTDGKGKMAPLRTLEQAQIHIEDFYLVGNDLVPNQDEHDD